MDDLLYVAANGARQVMAAQTANANNLANVSTHGFQADLAAFRELPVFGDGYASRVYTLASESGVDFSRGALQSTGRDLDVAVDGDGLIAIQGRDGLEAYTRAGDLQITSAGQLVNGAGYPVLGDGGPIAIPPFEKIEIGGDGTISFRPVGQSVNTLAVIDRIKLVNPPKDDLVKSEDGLLRSKSGLDAVPDATVGLRSGMLESSNVNAVESMVNMIELARRFDMQVKMMEAAKDNDAVSAELMSLSG